MILSEYTELISAIAALLGVLWGMYKNRQTNTVINYASDEDRTGETPTIIPAWMYTMPDSVIELLTKRMRAEERESFIAQVKAAEAQRLKEYKIMLKEGYFVILKGQVHGDFYDWTAQG